ncbi:hypothetical protein GGE06_001960 [Streptomyces sp. SFB5A]|uniref:Uncharacterized protein n=1 Tax=Streptomyces nymphaeiformis TaxID=2663842 RepID=A0A7W7TX90_9ACTN|nr:hypothetical protein [Streptomyces nymphaeiformis]
MLTHVVDTLLAMAQCSGADALGRRTERLLGPSASGSTR